MNDKLPEFGFINGYLPAGWHPATVETFRHRCVDAIIPDFMIYVGDEFFPPPGPEPHRAMLFAGYLKLHEALAALGIPTEQWIGGSFATAKTKPADINVINFCDAHAYEALPIELRAMLLQYFAGGDTARHCHCDSHLVPKGPPDHPCNADYLEMFRFWKKRFGHDMLGRPKGIIGITIEAPIGEEDEHAAT